VTYYYNLINWAPKYTNQVIHNGNLILKPGEEYVIENCTYTLNGTFLASANSTLVLRNAELWVKPTTNWDPAGPFPVLADLIFTNSSKLQMVNSTIICEGAIDVVLLNKSTADIQRSNLTHATLNGADDSLIRVDHSTLGIIDVASSSSCSIRNSQVDFLTPGYQAWMTQIQQFYPWENTRAEIINSTVRELGVKTQGSSVEVKGPLAGEFSSWSPAVICRGGRWFNVSVMDSNIGSVRLFAYNSTVDVVDNQDLNYLVVNGGSAKLSGVSIPVLFLENCTASVSGSVFTGFELMGDSVVSVRDSLVEGLGIDYFVGRLSCDQVSALRLTGNYVNGTVDGSLYFKGNESGIWSLQGSSRLMREFSVVAEAGGVLAPGVVLTLSKGNSTLWSGSTDASGQFGFNATYYHLWRLGVGVWADDNSTSILTLTARLGDEGKASNVTVESSTPIVFSFERTQEPPLWGNRFFLLVSGVLIIIGASVYVLLKKWHHSVF
jgi:hypothetical protein